MLKKIYDLGHSFLSVLGLFAVIGISIFTVNSLNPIAYTDNSNIGPDVAGLSTLMPLPFIMDNISIDTEDYTTSEKLVSERNYEYSAEFNSQEADTTRYTFVTLKNINNEKTFVQIETIIPENLINKIKIKLIDKLDTIILNYTDQGSVERKMTLEPLSERVFEIEYEFLEDINYSFEILFTIKN